MELGKFEELCKKKIPQMLKMTNGRSIYIYGAGKGGKVVSKILEDKEIDYKGFIDKKAFDIGIINGKRVYSISDIDKSKAFIIVSLMSYNYDLIEELLLAGYRYSDFYVLVSGEGCNVDDIEYRGCKIGKYTYGYDCLVSFYPIVESIGRYCSINGTAKVWNNHSLDTITTHPMLDHPLFLSWEKYCERRELTQKYGKHHNNHNFENSEIRCNEPINIGNDVWIGANVVILPGVKIGDGAVIAAGAVVTKNVAPYTIVGGVPAKPIRKRFDDQLIEILLKVKWWDWSEEEIDENIELFYDVELFRERYLKLVDIDDK